MKNKLLYLIFSTIACISFVNADYCQPTFNETCWSGNYNGCCDEMPAYDVDCGIYDAYSYYTLGTSQLIIPSVSFGYRERYARLGWDSALSFSTIGIIHQLTGHVVGHYYFNPSRQDSPYIGLGFMGGVFFGNHKDENFGILSTDIVFGKELARTDNSRHFIEMHVGIPTVCMFSGYDSFILAYPLILINYGISF